MNILVIGGTGTISTACVERAVEQGFSVTILNRGKTDVLPDPRVKRIQADIRDVETTKDLLKDKYFDVVVDFIAFTPDHVQADIELFSGKTSQFIFISSASAYIKPPTFLPITESAPLKNPYWQYSRDKIDCENLLMKAWYDNGFPVTIVRPSHTYNAATIPVGGYFTTIQRMIDGKKVVVHGDGTSLWTLTHHHDFAKGFTGLLGNPKAIGEAIHITSDEAITWNQIFQDLANAFGGTYDPVFVPSIKVLEYDKEWGDGLVGDKAHCLVFDNSKIKKLVPGFEATIPFYLGAREIANWYNNNPDAQTVSEETNTVIEEMISDFD